MEELLTAKELSLILKCSESTIYHWVSDEKIPYRKLGNMLRFNSDDISKWLETKKN